MKLGTARTLAPLLALASCSIPQALRGKGSGATSGATTASVAGGAKLDRLPDDGMTSATHAKFVGQIVFASAQISKSNPDEAMLASEFDADELLYGRVYMPRSLENHPVYAEGSETPRHNRGLGFYYKLYVDGALVPDQVETGESRDKRTATTRQVWLHPAASDEPTSKAWIDLVAGLAPGPHKLRLELWTRDGSFMSHEALAAGELTLHKSAGTTIGVGKTFADLKAGMTDPALAADLLAAAKAFVARAGTKDKVVAVTIKSAEWHVIHEPVRKRPVGREIQAWVRSDWPDGRCTAQTMWFEQKMQTSGPVGPISQKAFGDEQPLDCVARTEVATDRWAGRTRARPVPTGAKPVEPARVASAEPATSPEHSPPSRAKPARTAPAPVTVAAVSPEPTTSLATTSTVPAHARRPGPISVGVGMATNALDATGVASYANLGLHLGRLEVGAGATWPLDVIGYARFSVLSGRFDLAPMVSASMLAESKMDRQVAVSAGLSLAYQLTAAPMAIGLRLDALVSYNPDPAKLALPVLGSTYVRF